MNIKQIALAGLVTLSLVTSVSAISVTWSVAGVPTANIGTSADTITANANSGSVNLALGANTVSGLNTFDYVIGNSGNLTADFDFDVSRSLTIDGITHTLNQTGVGNINVDDSFDLLTVNPGATSATFILGNGYTVDVSVNGDSFEADFAVATASHPVAATFTLNYVPDGGTTVGLLGLGLVGCVLVSRKLKLA